MCFPDKIISSLCFLLIAICMAISIQVRGTSLLILPKMTPNIPIKSSYLHSISRPQTCPLPPAHLSKLLLSHYPIHSPISDNPAPLVGPICLLRPVLSPSHSDTIATTIRSVNAILLYQTPQRRHVPKTRHRLARYSGTAGAPLFGHRLSNGVVNPPYRPCSLHHMLN